MTGSPSVSIYRLTLGGKPKQNLIWACTSAFCYCYIMSRPRSESGPVQNWSSPDQNFDLGRPKSEFSSKLVQFETGPAKIRILILANNAMSATASSKEEREYYIQVLVCNILFLIYNSLSFKIKL